MKYPPLLAIALALSGCEGRNTPVDAVDDFALGIPVQPAPGPSIQRIDLPLSAILALKREDMGDIRVFDRASRPLSIALHGARLEEQAQRFAAVPFGSTGAAASGAGGTVSVQVRQSGGTVTVDTGTPTAPGGDEAVLVDTRKVAQPAVALVLDAVLPARKPVQVSVSVSDDLGTWQPLAERVLFSPDEGGSVLGGGRIALSGALLKDRYLRIAWLRSTGARVSGVTLYTTAIPPAPRIVVTTRGLALQDSRTAPFTVPTAASPVAVTVSLTGRDGTVPVQLLGRKMPEAPWTPLAFGTLRQGGSATTLEVGEPGIRQFMLRADARSAGFSRPPRIDLQFAGIGLIAAFNANGPYRLAVGNKAAVPSFLQAGDLLVQGAAIPVARLDNGPTPAPMDVGPSKELPFGLSPMKLALWAILLVGVGLLALAALRLLKVTASSGS